MHSQSLILSSEMDDETMYVLSIDRIRGMAVITQGIDAFLRAQEISRSHPSATETLTGIQCKKDIAHFSPHHVTTTDFDTQAALKTFQAVITKQRQYDIDAHEERQRSAVKRFQQNMTASAYAAAVTQIHELPSIPEYLLHPEAPYTFVTKTMASTHVKQNTTKKQKAPLKKTKPSNVKEPARTSKFPFKTFDECTSKATSKEYFISKKDLVQIIENDAVLKEMLGPKFASMTKEEICRRIFGTSKTKNA